MVLLDPSWDTLINFTGEMFLVEYMDVIKIEIRIDISIFQFLFPNAYSRFAVITRDFFSFMGMPNAIARLFSDHCVETR